MKRMSKLLLIIFCVGTLFGRSKPPLSNPGHFNRWLFDTGHSWESTFTLQNDEVLKNSTDSEVEFTYDDDAVTLAKFILRSDNAHGSLSANDHIDILIKADDAGGTVTTYGQIVTKLTAVAAGSEASEIDFWVLNGSGTSVEELSVVSTGLQLDNDEIIGNETDGTVQITFDDDAAALGTLLILSDNAHGSLSNSDHLDISFKFDDSGGTVTEYGLIKVIGTVVTAGSEASTMAFSVLNGSGAAATPVTITSTGIQLTNSLVIDNATDNKLEINENSDEMIINFGSNTISFSSGDVTTWNFGGSVADNITPALQVTGDADSDGSATTSETIGIDLTANATPTSAVWDITSTQSAGYRFDKAVAVGPATADDTQPTFSVQGDADSDAGGDTQEALTITLTPNATPTSATWGFTSTQSAGYTFDKAMTFSSTISTGANSGTSGQITFIASDNDQGTFTINTSDALLVAGFGGGFDIDGDFTAGTMTSDAGVSGTTVTASTGFALGDGDYLGITSNEIFTFNAAGTIVASGISALHVGGTATDNVTPDLLIVGDADSDGTDNTSETLTVALTANSTPTSAVWDITSTQSAGYRYDKSLTVGLATPDETTPALAIRGDADSDADDTTDELSVSLTANATPTSAVWDITSTQSAGYRFDKGVTIGEATADETTPALVVQGDADSDAGGDTQEAFTLDLTANATPTSAIWDITSTQSAGYRFDKSVTVGEATPDETTPTLAIRGDADSDADDTSEQLAITLTQNATPTSAYWDISSTQSAGYRYDKPITIPAINVLADTSTGYDTFGGTITPAPAALTEGMFIVMKAGADNTGACTLAFNGLASHSIKTQTGADPAAADIDATGYSFLIYDLANTVWVLINPATTCD